MTQQRKEPTDEQITELAETVSKYHIGCDLPITCNSECDLCAAKAIYKLGYRKLAKADKAKASNNGAKPKRQQKPPLLDSKGRLLAIIKAEREGKDINLTVVREIAVAQAQWDLWNEAIYGTTE